MRRLSSALILAAIAPLTACGGGSGSGSSALPALSGSKQMTDVQFRITIPQTAARLPKYISASTKSASIVVSPTGGAPMTPVNVNCTTSCSATVSAPVGSDQFEVKLWDAAGGTGNVLSHAIQTQSIISGTANSVSLAFGGVVKTITLTGPSSVTSAAPAAITITAKDAAGNTIVSENYDNPITLTNSDTSGTTSLNTTSVVSPTTAVSLAYTGASSSVPAAQIGASAAGATAAVPLTINKTSVAAASPVSFLTSGAGSILAKSTSATVAVISEYQTAQDSAPSSVGTTDQGSISLQVGANLTPLGTMRSSSTFDITKSHASLDDDAMGYRGTFRDLPLSDDWNAKYKELRNTLRRAPGPSNLSRSRQKQAFTPPAIGTVQNFWISSSSIGSSSGGHVSVPFVLKAISGHGLIWMDQSLSSTVLAYGSQIGTLFDNSYISDTSNYGSADYSTSSAGFTDPASNGPFTVCNPDQSHGSTTDTAFVNPPSPGYINVMVANGAAGGPLGGGVGGYFSALNFINQDIANCFSGGGTANPSNQVPMIVVGWFSDGTASGDQYELQEDLVRGTAHELQHLINFVNHVVINDQQNNDPRWLNEGLSVLSQDLASAGQIDIDDAFSHATAYLSHPQENSLTGFLRIVKPANTLAYNCGSCYGGSYLFARYMYDRFGGNAFTQSMTTGSTYGHASLLRFGGYSSLSALLGDFATALDVSNTGLSNDARYNFTNINLRNTYPSPHGNAAQVFTGPATLSIGAGGSPASIAGMPAGAFAFYNVTGLTGSGNAVKLTDATSGTSPMALTGAIIQH